MMMNNFKPKNSTLIFLSIVFSCIPLLFFLEIKTVIIVFFAFIFNLLIVLGKIKPPGKKTILFLTIVFTLILTINFKELFSRDAGVPLLIIMSFLKTLEIKTLRDELVACFLSFFILLSLILFSTSFFTTIYMFISAVFTLSVMGYINSPDKNLFQNIKKSILISLPSIIFAFVLFFFFPRIQTSLWGKQGSFKSISGFAQTISPGSVSSLAKNNEIAFKIKFDNNHQSLEKYFRGIVFNSFDGTSWHPDNPPLKGPATFKSSTSKKAFIILNPTYSKYIISPDYPLNSPEKQIYLTENSTLYSIFFKINDKKAYEIEYTNQSPTYPKPSKKHLKLPENFNPLTLELGSQWRSFPPEQRVYKGIEFLRKNKFIYTLNPPKYGKNYIDEFLFDKREGFCEHFASSFAFLMRAAKIPSRITGGYLGGEENPIGGFFSLRQSDAHAWCEVWLGNKGWIRIDPTTESTPSRLEENMEQIFSSDFNSGRSFFKFTKPFTKLTDALNFFWDQKIISYNFNIQNEFFKFLGLKNQSFLKKSALLIFVCFFLFFWVYFSLKLKVKLQSKKSKELILFEKMQKKLKNKNFAKKPWEGYYEYLKRIEKSNLKNQELIKDFINIFVLYRYSGEKSEKNIVKMKMILKKLRF